ncbi:MAG: U32 family peptidase [Muribaculaceae bacterium]|nr:U32 family peptidase [Muribaculaceae bacterium]
MDYRKRTIELLAPARDAHIAVEAVKHGADAVYMGAVSHGARAAAGNSVGDIARVVEFAHRFDARVYVTVNTVIYDSELKAVERLVHNLYRIGVDALIVQDMALLRMDIPPIALHASTQCDTRDAAKALFLQQSGFSQIVLARELSLEEIARIYDTVEVPLEAFVHGALCVSYSGDCQASCLATGRSANRGECAQMCRLPYTLADASGRVLVADKHLLSLRDMNRSAYLAQMMDAGISSFKIEGRLKDVGYVKNTVAYYRRAIDAVIAAAPERYSRLSSGRTELDFTPALEKSFNRGFTPYFLCGIGQDESIASVDTPKSRGEVVGRVVSAQSGRIAVELDTPLNNGDGIVFFDSRGRLEGFRLNRVEGNLLYPAGKVSVRQGTLLYRNRDKAWDEILERDTARRLVDVGMVLRATSFGIALDVSDSRGNAVTVTMPVVLEQSRTSQVESRYRTLAKTGGTIYCVGRVDDRLGDVFVPASRLTALRRDAIDALDRAQRVKCRYDYRRDEDRSAVAPQGERLTYHDNVANSLAGKFYRSHGVTSVEKAIELDSGSRRGPTVVMTSRYCLRREMGRCLKTPAGKKWSGPLYIRSSYACYRLDFDCRHCHMKVVCIGDVDKNA